jgi:hypothetical protein
MPQDTHPEIVVSKLSKRVSDKGSYVDVHIYRLGDQPRWTLEIIDECGGYTIWDEWFDTEQAALDKALRAVSAFGINSFLEDNRSRPTHH